MCYQTDNLKSYRHGRRKSAPIIRRILHHERICDESRRRILAISSSNVFSLPLHSIAGNGEQSNVGCGRT